jgi:hypothetical protein
MASTADELREEVRRRYAESAQAVTDGSAGCGCGSGRRCDDSSANAIGSMKFGEVLYALEQRDELPDAAILASLGCGNPVAVADLHEGETVLDLGGLLLGEELADRRERFADNAEVRPTSALFTLDQAGFEEQDERLPHIRCARSRHRTQGDSRPRRGSSRAGEGVGRGNASCCGIARVLAPSEPANLPSGDRLSSRQ